MSKKERKIGQLLVLALLSGALLVGLLTLRSTPVYAHMVPSPCDFTTGGGFVFKDDGNRVNFGIVGGCKNGGFFGHVNVVDHGFNPHAHLNGPVTAYFNPFPNGPSGYRDLCGTGRLNDGSTVKFRVRTKDNGEPGGDDRFGVKVSNGYLLTTRELGPSGPTGGGGNIQLHKHNPSNTGPYLTEDQITAACGGDDSGLGF